MTWCFFLQFLLLCRSAESLPLPQREGTSYWLVSIKMVLLHPPINGIKMAPLCQKTPASSPTLRTWPTKWTFKMATWSVVVLTLGFAIPLRIKHKVLIAKTVLEVAPHLSVIESCWQFASVSLWVTGVSQCIQGRQWKLLLRSFQRARHSSAWTSCHHGSPWVNLSGC